MWLNFFLILLGIGFGLKVEFVGTISISELFVMAYFVYFLFRHREFWRLREFRIATWLYAALLFFQILSELVVRNAVGNMLRGLAVTMVSYCYFAYLLRIFRKGRGRLAWVLMGLSLSCILFPSEMGDFSQAMEGEGANYLKFVVAPMVSYFLLALFVWTRSRWFSLVFMLVGAFFLSLGARSQGAILFMAGLASLFFMLGVKINRARVVALTLCVAAVGCWGYKIYVDRVLSYEIDSGNVQQFRKVENPYNPWEVLLAGRTEAYVGWRAFMDKPLFGHGAWAEDVGWKYRVQMAVMKEKKLVRDNEDLGIIPSHSVLIGTGTNNGIFAFCAMAALLSFFFSRGVRMLLSKDVYLLVIIYFLLQLLWNALFSPISHMRNSFPMFFAFMLSSHLVYEQRLGRSLTEKRKRISARKRLRMQAKTKEEELREAEKESLSEGAI